MGAYVADEVVKLMLHKGTQVVGSDVLVLGFTFKENCPDVRNTKVIDIVRRLEEYKVNVCIHDPWADPKEVEHEYGVICQNGIEQNQKYDAIIVAVAHNEFKAMKLEEYSKENAVIYDIKCALAAEIADARL
jgi:UDP-N-acetyl-D-galactosamine dehydrogenase